MGPGLVTIDDRRRCIPVLPAYAVWMRELPTAIRARRKCGKMKILVVEDDKTMRTVMCHLLKALDGAEVIEASDGVEACKLFDQGLRPDLCIVDMIMPHMDGQDLVQHIRFHPELKRLKVLMCSSIKERHRMAQIASLEISGYIIKPFSAIKIQEEVRRVLGLPPSPSPNPKPQAPPVEKPHPAEIGAKPSTH